MVTRRVVAPPSRCSVSGRWGGDAGSSGGDLDASFDHDGSAAVVRVRGSLRSGTAATLREAVESALDTRPAAVVLDLTAVVADDALGLWAVPTVAGDAARCGIPLTVVAPDRKLRTRLRRLGARHVEITDAAPVER